MRTRASQLVTGGIVAALALTACGPPPAPPRWASDLVSVNAAGDNGSNAPAQPPAMHPSGTHVAFYTQASDLGPADANDQWDVYLRSLSTGTTTLVSRTATGAAGNGNSSRPVFSPDGSLLAFTSGASDLSAGAGGPGSDVFVYDLAADELRLVPLGPTPCGSAHAGAAMFSPDGSRLAFALSYWSAGTDVMVADLTTGETTLGTPRTSGPCPESDWAYPRAFSPDGRRLLITSNATDLGPTDGNFTEDAYLRDLEAGTTALVSSNAAGTSSGNGESRNASFSPDGSRVLFTSRATDLGPPVSHAAGEVYVRDLATGTTSMVTANADGTDGQGAGDLWAGFDGDGSHALFVSFSGALGPVDTNGTADVYARDLATGETLLVSANADRTDAGNGMSGVVRVAGDRVVFRSRASNLGPADTNGVDDLYVRDLDGGPTGLVTADAAGSDGGNGRSDFPSVSADGAAVAYLTAASDLGPADTNGLDDVYVARLG